MNLTSDHSVQHNCCKALWLRDTAGSRIYCLGNPFIKLTRKDGDVSSTLTVDVSVYTPLCASCYSHPSYNGDSFFSSYAEVFTDKCFVYFFYDKDMRPLYIGKTRNLLRRYRSHKARATWFSSVYYVGLRQYDCLTDMDIAELYYINKHDPPNNIQSNNHMPVSKITLNDSSEEFIIMLRGFNDVDACIAKKFSDIYLQDAI